MSAGWRPYLAHGRRKLRVGVWRVRSDRVCPEYRFIQIERCW